MCHRFSLRSAVCHHVSVDVDLACCNHRLACRPCARQFAKLASHMVRRPPHFVILHTLITYLCPAPSSRLYSGTTTMRPTSCVALLFAGAYRAAAFQLAGPLQGTATGHSKVGQCRPRRPGADWPAVVGAHRCRTVCGTHTMAGVCRDPARC